MEGDREGFLGSCEECRRIAFSFREPLIVHHYDADGLSAGSLVAAAFLDEGRPFRRECIKKLDDAAINRYLKESELIFVDLGGGNKRVNELKDVLVIDHHQTEGISKPQANPQLFGMDGGSELSASGTAYCVFRKRADLAIVGAVGDMQSPLIGMNRWVLEQGVADNEVKVEDDLKLYGRYCRPLAQFLAYSDDPYVPGISYREDKCSEMLLELGIKDGSRTYSGLTDEERKRLASALAKILISSNRLRSPADLISESYVFPQRSGDETYEANEFSTLLNACGRHSRDDVGFRVCIGDAGASAEARALLLEHRRKLREGISFALARVQDLGAFYFLDARGVIDENIIGTVCGMCTQSGWTKPIIGIALGEDGTIKASARATKRLVASGLDLGAMMKKASEELGGAGGGHAIAAGASIPKASINRFLLICGEAVNSALRH